MLYWNNETIKYLSSAEIFSNSAKLIIDNIKKYFANTENALEIACGLGNVSIELSKYFNNIDCFDIEKSPIDFLTNYCENHKINNIHPKVMSSNENINIKYDLILSNYYYDEKNSINIINNNLEKNGVFIILIRKDEKRAMAPNSKYTHRNRSIDIENNFSKNEFVLEKNNFILIKNQPLINKNDIINYLSLYDDNIRQMNINEKDTYINTLIQNKVLIPTASIIDKSSNNQNNESQNFFSKPLTKEQIDYILNNNIKYIYKVERPTNIYIIKRRKNNF